MPFYLVKNQLVTFGEFIKTVNKGYLSAGARIGNVPACFIACDEKNKEQVVCAEEIRNLIISSRPILAAESNWILNVQCYILDPKQNTSTQNCMVSVSGDCVNGLLFANSFNRVCIKTTLTQFGIIDIYKPKQFKLEFETRYQQQPRIGHLVYYQFPKDLEYAWTNNCYKFQGYLTVEVLIDDGVMAQQTVNGKVTSFDLNEATAKILKDMVNSDMVIVSKDGAETKCHKCFLAGHSDVFKAMLEGNYLEAKDGRLEMPDVSEKSVKAFLQFIYSGDLEAATNDFETALELFSIGHKYDIGNLEQSMRCILLSKNDSMSIDEALRMFLLARNIDSADNLKLKAVEVLKLNPSLLGDSNVYKELVVSEPKVVTELLQSALQK